MQWSVRYGSNIRQGYKNFNDSTAVLFHQFVQKPSQLVTVIFNRCTYHSLMSTTVFYSFSFLLGAQEGFGFSANSSSKSFSGCRVLLCGVPPLRIGHLYPKTNSKMPSSDIHISNENEGMFPRNTKM